MHYDLIEKGLAKLSLDISDEQLQVSGVFGKRSYHRSEIKAAYLLANRKSPDDLSHPDLKQILPPGFQKFSQHISNSQQLLIVIEKAKHTFINPRSQRHATHGGTEGSSQSVRIIHKKKFHFVIFIPQSGKMRESLLQELEKSLSVKVNNEGLDYWEIVRREDLQQNPIVTFLGVIFILAISIFILGAWWSILYFKDSFMSPDGIVSILLSMVAELPNSLSRLKELL